jgi:hypothetical protein
MRSLFLALLLLLGSQGMAKKIDLETVSLRRQDMPEGFPYQVSDEGFAVLRITLVNRSEEDWELQVDDIEVYNQKGKRIKRALPAEITPKILKYYTGITGYGGYRVERTDQKIVSLDTVQGLRRALEEHEIADTRLEPGETAVGFYYVKSKRSGSKLSGGWVTLNELKADY